MRKVPWPPPSRPAAPTGLERVVSCLDRCDWALVDSVWDVGTLWFVRAGDWHATWVSFLEDGSHWGWYVNLQDPFERLSNGISAMDLMLDVVVEPELVDDATARRIRDEAAAVLRDLDAGAPPFCEPWTSWRPDPAWPRPLLP